jgi:hypothetical protein
MKEFYESLLPKGTFWRPVVGGFLDNFLDGIGDNLQEIYEFLRGLARIRNPYLTPYLSDLEKEYGIITDLRLSEETRRQILAAAVYAAPGTGSQTDLQTALHTAGFTNLFVYQNSPAVDPRRFLGDTFICVAGNATSVAGNANAIAGIRGGGYLLVNQSAFTLETLYSVVAGGIIAIAGNPNAVAGGSDGIKSVPVDFDVPDDPERWNYIFFVGGTATGWETFVDWDMNKPYTTDWTAGDYTTLSKDSTVTNSFPYSLRVIASDSPLSDSSSTFYYPYLIDSALVSRWRLYDPGDGTIRDLSGNNFGTNNGATNTVKGAGRGMIFNGTTDYIDVGTTAGDYTDDFTLQCVIDTSVGGTILSRRAGTSQWEWRINTGSGFSEFVDSSGSVVGTGAINLLDGNEHILAVAIDGSNSQIFTDGAVDGSTFSPTISSIVVNTEIGSYNGGASNNFGGILFFPEIYSDVKDVTWAFARWRAFAAKQHAGYTDFRDTIIVDGDMELTGTANWAPVNNATISKQTGSALNQSQVLRITGTGTAGPGAIQTVSGTLGNLYRIRGVARGDGTNIPTVSMDGVTVWTGTSSTTWQYIDVSRAAATPPNTILLAAGASTGYVEYDQMSMVDTPVPSEKDIVDETGNYDGIGMGAIRGYSPYGPSYILDGSGYLDGDLAGEQAQSLFTLTAWVRTTNKGGSIIRRENATSIQWNFFINSSGQIAFDDGTSVGTGSTDVTDGNYHFVVVVVFGASSKLYVDGVDEGATFTPSIPASILNLHTEIGYQFVGNISIPRIYFVPFSPANVLVAYNADGAISLDGSYAEQILGTATDTNRTISGYMWGDGNGAIPTVFAQLPDNTWEFVASGLDSTDKIYFEEVVSAGIKGVRLYNKFSPNGYVNFDDIAIFDPSIERAQVPNEQREQLEKIILKQKPLHSWCGLVVEFT